MTTPKERTARRRMNGALHDADVYKAENVRLHRQLASPPAGWFPFGHHVDQPDVRLEFWGDDGGIPIWERPTLDARAEAGARAVLKKRMGDSDEHLDFLKAYGAVRWLSAVADARIALEAATA